MHGETSRGTIAATFCVCTVCYVQCVFCVCILCVCSVCVFVMFCVCTVLANATNERDAEQVGLARTIISGVQVFNSG